MTASASTVLITGAGQRIGKAIATDLAVAGWDVGLHFNQSGAEAERAAAEITGLGRKSALIQADLSDTGIAASIMAETAEKLGAPVALINCASVFEEDTAQDYTEETWSKHLDVNLRAPIELTRAFAEVCPANMSGSVINFVDQRVLKPTPQFFTYTLSKLALWQATKTLAQTYAPQIRVNAIAPGPTLQNARQEERDFKAQCEATPLKTGSPVSEICRGVRYLLDASAVTGQTLTIDGGQHLIWQTPDVVGIKE